MQAVENGFWGKAQTLDPEKLTEMFRDDKVEHVEVFPATKKNLEKAKKREGKKFSYSCGHGYKKAPKIKTKNK